MQKLWLEKTNWDDIASPDIAKMWECFRSELPDISHHQFSRLVIHGFCDSSSIGYGCVIYFRFVTRVGQVKLGLIFAKSRVAPLKTLSIPRLELCSAYLLAEMLVYVKRSCFSRLTFDTVYAWSDSQVALSWIAASPHRWKTFVANRVAQIQERVNSTSWHYVPTHLNPANCVSRGCTPLELRNHPLWWEGPDFLLKRPDEWPSQPLTSCDANGEVAKEEHISVLQVTLQEPHFITVQHNFLL